MPPDSSTAKMPARGIARRLQDMTPDERRAHLIPASKAKQYADAKRQILRVLSTKPDLTDEQRADLAAIVLRGEV